MHSQVQGLKPGRFQARVVKPGRFQARVVKSGRFQARVKLGSSWGEAKGEARVKLEHPYQVRRRGDVHHRPGAVLYGPHEETRHTAV